MRATQLKCWVVTRLQFNADGNLPEGIHLLSWDDFAALFGRTPERRRLIGGCLRALQELRQAGCQTAYVGGSLVPDKERIYGTPPSDFDGCWDGNGVDPDRLDLVLLQFADRCAAQKLKYFGELYPTCLPAGRTGGSFLEFFQTDKHTGQAKGIVQLDLEHLP